MNIKNLSNIGRRSFLSNMTAAAGCILAARVNVSARENSAEIPQQANLALISPNDSSKPYASEKNMRNISLSTDVLVAGGGLAGVLAAIAAARKGAKVVICQDRSRLGGNASAEVRMHPLGVNSGRNGFREGGILEEIKLDCAVHNPHCSWELWDLSLYDKLVSLPNITVLLDTTVFGAEVSKDGSKINNVRARCDTSRTIYTITAKQYIDCTGDARLAMEAGDDLMFGREKPERFGESLADYDDEGTCMGSTILFTAKDLGRPIPYKAPDWAVKIKPEMLKKRRLSKRDISYGYWWIELGGDTNAVSDNERLRFELLRVVLGIWDYLKNEGAPEEAANYALDFIGMIPARRETYRIVSEYIMTQSDIEGGWKKFDDPVCVGGWSMDDHPKKGFYDFDRAPCRQAPVKPYNIPFGSLISKKIKNLMMAGRNAGVSHVALSSTRVMATTACMGQAVGTAAALCVAKGVSASQLRADKNNLEELKQTLLRDDQTILGIKNTDSKDLALKAKVTASASAEGTKPENVINGVSFDTKPDPKSPRGNENRWLASVSGAPWLRLSWNEPQKISEVEITFDTGCRNLAISGSAQYRKSVLWAPQSECVKDFVLSAVDQNGNEKILAEVKDNYQRKVRLSFDPISARSIKLKILSTNGDKLAAVYEIRAYA